jgi:hypothetical protein
LALCLSSPLLPLFISLFSPQILRLFLASYQRLLALLGSPSSSTILHIGLFISLSSELAVAASPLPHRLQQGLLYQRITIKELQVRLCVCTYV